MGIELISTGGTSEFLSAAGLPVTPLSDVTGFPEILDGRVKTLHPKIHGGILARRDSVSHINQLSDHNIEAIDIVICNLYPFVETVGNPNVSLSDALENIDIGGPTMIRAAAKNFPHVIVLVDPIDYQWVANRLGQKKNRQPEIDETERRALAQKAFQHVALYDTAISEYLDETDGIELPEKTVGFTKLHNLSYGENPHQRASLYSNVLSSGGIVNAEQLLGQELSFNNILDADAAWTTVSEFSDPTVAIIKHTNPCGLAIHENQTTAYQRALEGDPVSAYGGIVGFNRTLTVETAEAMRGLLFHVIVAPDFEPKVLEILQKRKQLRLLKATPPKGSLVNLDVRKVSGGALVQTTDSIIENPSSWKIATKRAPTDTELQDLAFAIKASKHIRSNTIVLAKNNAMVGMGAGQPNRVTSVHLALRIAGEKTDGSVLASDAFMPFPDNIEVAAEGGITAIAQPGGSIRDEDVIAAADRFGMAMVFTGIRHFKH